MYSATYNSIILIFCRTCILIGIKVNSPMGVVTAHAMLLQCSADLQARAPMTNMKTFNGKWGCLYCLCPGSTTPSDRLHRFWPYDPSGGARSPESFLDDGKQALVNADGAGVSLSALIHCTCMHV